MKFTRHDIARRLADCSEHGYDPWLLSTVWGIKPQAAMAFMRRHCRNEYFLAMSERDVRPVYAERERPEYENQRLFDMYVLGRREWCIKWDIPLWEYGYYLRMYERKHGEIATPEIRELWENMGE